MRWAALGLGMALLGLIVTAAVRPVRPVVQLRSATGDIDRCPTCHPQVLPATTGDSGDAAHGGHAEIAGHADLSRFGCTACHGGQGRRLDMEAHGPPLGGGPRPFLRAPFVQAYCARCHVPADLKGAEALGRGMRDYLSAGCLGCHQPGRRGAARGPDLRRLGRRSSAELKAAIVKVRVDQGSAVMPSYRLRYPDTAQGQAALRDLITALLALQLDPVPFRDHWHAPLTRVDVDCLRCHMDPSAASPPSAPPSGGSAPEASGPRHRCSLLKKKPSLRCTRCHDASSTQRWAGHRQCPQINAMLPSCPVCHLRPHDRPL